jgi:anti-sigma B factor antagonist
VSSIVLATERDGAVLLVRAAGELDMKTAPQLARALEQAQGEGASLVLDMAGVTFIDSSGLSVLISAERRARERETRFAVRPGAATGRILAIAGVRIETLDEERP